MPSFSGGWIYLVGGEYVGVEIIIAKSVHFLGRMKLKTNFELKCTLGSVTCALSPDEHFSISFNHLVFDSNGNTGVESVELSVNENWSIWNGLPSWLGGKSRGRGGEISLRRCCLNNEYNLLYSTDRYDISLERCSFNIDAKLAPKITHPTRANFSPLTTTLCSFYESFDDDVFTTCHEEFLDLLDDIAWSRGEELYELGIEETSVKEYQYTRLAKLLSTMGIYLFVFVCFHYFISERKF
jgi:hypothetical protein